MFAEGFPHRGYLKINSTWVGIEPMSYSHNWFLTSLKDPMTLSYNISYCGYI